jgi:hypothetical protein
MIVATSLRRLKRLSKLQKGAAWDTRAALSRDPRAAAFTTRRRAFDR